MIDEDFRTLLASMLPNGVVIEKGKISEEQIPVRVYYQRSQENNALDLDGTQGLTETNFDVEVAALDDDATVQTMAEQLNNALMTTITTLDGSANTSTTSLTVHSSASIPTSGLPYIIGIGSEKLAVTAVSGTTLTVSRAYKSTTAVNHANNAAVFVSGLNGYRGQSSSGWIHGCFVSDQSDEYDPRMLDADEGYAVASFSMQVIHD